MSTSAELGLGCPVAPMQCGQNRRKIWQNPGAFLGFCLFRSYNHTIKIGGLPENSGNPAGIGNKHTEDIIANVKRKGSWVGHGKWCGWGTGKRNQERPKILRRVEQRKWKEKKNCLCDCATQPEASGRGLCTAANAKRLVMTGNTWMFFLSTRKMAATTGSYAVSLGMAAECLCYWAIIQISTSRHPAPFLLSINKTNRRSSW